jgi:hypothetical protein
MKRLVAKKSLSKIAKVFKYAGVMKDYDVDGENIKLYFISNEEDYSEQDQKVIEDMTYYNKLRTNRSDKGIKNSEVYWAYAASRPEGDYYSPFKTDLEKVFPGADIAGVEDDSNTRSKTRNFDYFEKEYGFPNNEKIDDVRKNEHRKYNEEDKQNAEDRDQKIQEQRLLNIIK